MKKAILYSLVSSGVLLLAGCNETWDPVVGGEGSIMPIVNLDSNTISSGSDKQAARSSAGEISVDMLHLRLTPTSTTGTAREWTSLGDFNVEEKFSVGTYNFEAYYGDKSTEGFDAAYYYGVTTVSVRENETTNVSLTASLGNAMLSIKYTEAFVSYFSDYSVNIKTLLNNTITYTRRENRPVYVAPGTVNLAVNVVKQDGTSATINATGFAAVARHHYNVTLDVNNGDVGNAELVISFDDTLDREDVVINLEDLENIPEPTVKADGFIPGEAIGIVAGSVAENPLVFTILARGGIASAVLETKSTALKEEGWPESIDLIGTPEATKSTMSSLGFKEIGLWHNPDQMAVVDLSGVIPYIKYIEGVSNQSMFTLRVTDKVSQYTEPVTLAVNIEKLLLAITGAEPIMYYDNTAIINIGYNGADAANRIGVEYKTKYGTFSELKIESVIAGSRAMSSYVFEVTGLPNDADQGEDDVVLRAYLKDADGKKVEKSESEEFTLTRAKVPFSLSVDENDVFALRVSGVMAHESESVTDFAGRAKLEMSTDGGVNYREYTYTIDGDRIKIEGLKSSTGYKARIQADGMTCRPVTFTTEAELKLPNCHMDEWYSENGATGNQKWYYPWTQGAADMAWNTYNPVTMSQGSSTVQSNYGYDATSGTVFTSDSKAGSAAQIRTVGWGSGNSASSSLPTSGNRWKFGTCKHVSAGQLFLGNWDNVTLNQDAVPNYGMNFTSRPSSMTFWYKYAVMNRNGNDNGQRGVAIIQILDSSGKVVSEKTELLELNASYNNLSADTDYSVGGEYVEKEMQLEYPVNASKASRIVVTFKSSQLSNSELENLKNQDNMRPPKPMNLSNHEYLGSSLLIDEITLNY